MSQFDVLPREVISSVILPLLKVPDLAGMARVSKSFHSMLKSDLTIWMKAMQSVCNMFRKNQYIDDSSYEQ